MTGEKDFWINKDEVYVLSNSEGTAYKVKQEMMNKRGWYKLAGDEQIVKKAELTKKEAEWFEKNKNLPFFKNDSTEHFTKKVLDYSVTWEDRERCCNLFSQAYFNGYTVKKEPKYYIKFQFGNNCFGCLNYLNVHRDNGGFCIDNNEGSPHFKTQFTQSEINQMQKDPQAEGLNLNTLKIKVPEDELED